MMSAVSADDAHLRNFIEHCSALIVVEGRMANGDRVDVVRTAAALGISVEVGASKRLVAWAAGKWEAVILMVAGSHIRAGL